MRMINHKKVVNMMRNLILIFSVVIAFSLKAQEEYLSILKNNASLKAKTEKYRNTTKKEFIEDNIIITSDSISLPFIDDFSSNTLKPYDFSAVINDTVQYAAGTCLNSNFATESMGFQTSPSYYYFYDTTNNHIDSTALSSINVYNYSGGNCFPNETSITAFWPSYYRSVDTNFNTTTGAKLDSFLVTPDTTMNIATIYFATMPKNVNWLDNFAWWNTTNPIEPISIGVATLDGLNEFGLPYNNTVINAYGKADYLTSKPIDLSLLGIGDDVYLSFFYQAAGLGDAPNPEDSLVVDFKGINGVWTRKWSTAGIPSSDFKQVYIPIYETNFDSLIYSNSDFQFRIRNYASLSGNND